MTTLAPRTPTVTARTDTGSPQPAAAPRHKPARRPYTATSVRYVEQGVIITAVWVSDPAIDPAVALDNILRTDLPYEVEVIAAATRFYKRDGATFSGWVVSVGGGLSHSDPLPNKREAMAQLRRDVAECFQRGAHA